MAQGKSKILAVSVEPGHPLCRLLGLLADTENIRLEPSALAGLPGMSLVGDWAERQGIDLRNAVHIAWATGGSMVPEDIWQEYYSLGA